MSVAATFYFDVGSPYAYLAAERVDRVLPIVPEWQPVLLGGIFKARNRSSWATTPRRALGMGEVEARAAAYGLPPVVWPDPLPNDSLLAMRVAIAAFERGFGKQFALEAFRIQFVEGRPLVDPHNVARAIERCDQSPDDLLAAAADPEIKQLLRAATEAALEAGITGVPSVLVRVGSIPPQVYWGDDRLEAAAGALADGSADHKAGGARPGAGWAGPHTQDGG